MQYMKIEPSHLPTTNIFIQSFNFQMNTTITQRGGLADKFRMLINRLNWMQTQFQLS